MSTVKDNPIPVGRYWSDLIGDNASERWTGWREKVAQERVKVIKTVHHDASGDQPARDWVLYEVTSPVFYDYKFYAPVNTATGVADEEDTVTKPDPAEIDILPDINIGGSWFPDLRTAPYVIGFGLAAVAAGTWAAVKFLSKKNSVRG